MLRNYLTIALRNLSRQKGYTAINVAGLAVGMTVCLLIGLYVYHEWSYDRFHEKSDRIVQVGIETGSFGQMITTPFPLGDVIASDVSAAEHVVRTGPHGNQMLVDETTDLETNVRFITADEAFFDVFSFETIEGGPSHALTQPDGLVLTASVARTFFGSENAVGRTLMRESESHTVHAVVEDVPEHSTIQFDAVVPFGASGREQRADSWGVPMFSTYVLLHDGSTDRDAFIDQVERAIARRTDRELNPFALDLPDVYLSALHQAEGFRGQLHYLYIFGSIALFILLIAAINYVNLATALGMRRAREVGVRKAMGAARHQLARQFLLESVLLSGIAFVLALILLPLILPAFNSAFGTNIVFGLGLYGQALALLAAFVLLLGVAAGAYPAFILTRFDPIRVLRHQQVTGSRGSGWLRRGLVVTQFAISTALIVGTVVVYQQLHFMQTKHLGFDGEQVVTVPLPPDGWDSREAIAQEVSAHPDVLLITLAQAVPGRPHMQVGLRPEEISARHRVRDDNEQIAFAPAVVDHNFIETLGMNVVAGRDFDRDRPGDLERAIILNESGARRMGWSPEEAIGMPFSLGQEEGEIIGIVEDYHITALHYEIDPVALMLREGAAGSEGILTARLHPDGIRSGLDHVEATLSAFAPDADFDYQFLDEAFHFAYQGEVRLSRIFSAFAFIAILIAGLGLVGLAAHSAQQRTKEIGIRKVLGATVAHILALLSKEFAMLVGVAVVIGTPVAYIVMNQWLEDFAYRIAIGPTTFVITTLTALLIAFVSVGYHALRAAFTDPADALRSE